MAELRALGDLPKVQPQREFTVPITGLLQVGRQGRGLRRDRLLPEHRLHCTRRIPTRLFLQVEVDVFGNSGT